MSDEKTIEKVAESGLCYRILKELSGETKNPDDFVEKTPTELAESLDTSSQSINNYLRMLMALDLVVKTEKRGRKQPYRFNTDAPLSKIFWHYWDKKIAEGTEFDTYEEFKDSDIAVSGYNDVELPNRDEYRDELDSLLVNFLKRFFWLSDDYTIKEILTDVFSRQTRLILMEKDKEDLPNWMRAILSLILMADVKDIGSYPALKQALGETLSED